MSKTSIVLVDLDGCYVLRDKAFFERVLENLAGLFMEDARIEGITLFYQLLRGNENIYKVNKKLIRFLDSRKFDKEVILTARRRKDLNSERMDTLNELCEHFDSIVFYPGRTGQGEKITERESSALRYFLGLEYVDYKMEVAEDYSLEHQVFIVDNSEKVVGAASSRDFIKKQFLVKGTRLFEVDERGNRRPLDS